MSVASPERIAVPSATTTSTAPTRMPVATSQAPQHPRTRLRRIAATSGKPPHRRTPAPSHPRTPLHL
jgi:hypothetical protein